MGRNKLSVCVDRDVDARGFGWGWRRGRLTRGNGWRRSCYRSGSTHGSGTHDAHVFLGDRRHDAAGEPLDSPCPPWPVGLDVGQTLSAGECPGGRGGQTPRPAHAGASSNDAVSTRAATVHRSAVAAAYDRHAEGKGQDEHDTLLFFVHFETNLLKGCLGKPRNRSLCTGAPITHHVLGNIILIGSRQCNSHWQPTTSFLLESDNVIRQTVL